MAKNHYKYRFLGEFFGVEATFLEWNFFLAQLAVPLLKTKLHEWHTKQSSADIFVRESHGSHQQTRGQLVRRSLPKRKSPHNYVPGFAVKNLP